MANPVSETQAINPGSVIELFELTTDAALHGSATTYRFHAGSEINNSLGWNTYIAIPLLMVLNMQMVWNDDNTVTNCSNIVKCKLEDLTGAVLNTTARFLDAAILILLHNNYINNNPSDAETVTYTVTVVTDIG